MKVGLYIHIPFCRKKCPYCDFYSVSYDKKTAYTFIDILIHQISRFKNVFDFDTVYIGGGTPSCLDLELLEKLLDIFKDRNIQEFTIEANPDSLSFQKLRLFRERGVNRLSIGVQSFNDNKLKRLGRIHSSHQAKQAIEMALKEKFTNVNIDLIFGVYQERFWEWKQDLKTALNFPITHISIYNLTYERDTLLYKRLQNKEIKPLTDEEEARMYIYGIKFLKKRGFTQYEISNFSKKGYQCQHNMKYWLLKPFLGLGPSAVSFINNRYSKYPPDINKYICNHQIHKGTCQINVNSKEKMLIYKVILGLRMLKGVEVSWKALPGEFKLKIRDLLKQKYVKYNRLTKRLSLTSKGVRFFDEVAVGLL